MLASEIQVFLEAVESVVLVPVVVDVGNAVPLPTPI